MANATHFFLGANSGGGFQNLFERFCRSENHYDLLILKGGPGCGKSTMMRKIGEAMENLGEQVEYLHCSGDPESLDGINIPRIHMAAVDGTAPHSIDARYPAAVERYIDLGRFYDIAAAKEAKGEIICRTEACSEAYRSAYRILGAATKLEENAENLMMQALDRDRLHRRTAGIVCREIRGKGSGGPDRYRFLGSMTCAGPILRLDSAETLCPRIYALLGSAAGAAMMLSHIHSEARARQYASILCPDPEHMNRLEHLLIPELGLGFVSVKNSGDCPREPYRRIHLDAMLCAEENKLRKGKLKLTKKLISTLRQEGAESLQEAKREHDALEALYLPGVDFAGIDELTKIETERIKQYL